MASKRLKFGTALRFCGSPEQIGRLIGIGWPAAHGDIRFPLAARLRTNTTGHSGGDISEAGARLGVDRANRAINDRILATVRRVFEAK
jgi:hypothetical protein